MKIKGNLILKTYNRIRLPDTRDDIICGDM